MLLNHYPVVYTQDIAWGDMDAFGHVNNVMYYRYMESARIAYLQRLNLLSQDFNTVIASSHCQYLQAVVYPDQLKIGVRVEELRNSAFRMHYLLWSEAQQKMIAQGEAVVVCVDKINMAKVSIPEQIKFDIRQLEITVSHAI